MPVCGESQKSVASISGLYLHSRIVHFKEKSDSFKCAEENCNRVFCNWYHFKKHLSKHAMNFDVQEQSRVLEISNIVSKDHYDEKEEASQSCNDVIQGPSNMPNIAFDSRECTTKFIAKLYANHQLPRNFVQTITDNTKELLSDLTSRLKPTIINIIENANVDKKTISSVGIQMDFLFDPFVSRGSEHIRMKALMESGSFIKSIDHNIGSKINDKLKQGHAIKEIVPVYTKFIPLR